MSVVEQDILLASRTWGHGEGVTGPWTGKGCLGRRTKLCILAGVVTVWPIYSRKTL